MVTSGHHDAMIQAARVSANQPLCREHYRLTCRLEHFGTAGPGQFVHLCPVPGGSPRYRTLNTGSKRNHDGGPTAVNVPLLRRAFSIARLVRHDDGVALDVIYRVVGAATRWMASLEVNNRLSVFGPLGRRFPIHAGKPVAWLVAGGVGLPPMLWLAQALRQAGKRTAVFCGARTADLLPLTFDPADPPDVEARRATGGCHEFARSQAGVVVSTDDGSLGYRGHVGAALAAYHKANPIAVESLVVYPCGPEPMMRFVAEYCISRGIECYVCMERAMACGTGLCQSCVVPVRDSRDPDGWRYRLCCTDGPVLAAREIIWEPAGLR